MCQVWSNQTLVFQVRRFRQARPIAGPIYDVEMFFVEDTGEETCTTHVMRTRYYAVGIPVLLALMERAGFVDVRRLDGVYFQPLLVGTRAPDRPPGRLPSSDAAL